MGIGSGHSGVLVDQCKWVRAVDNTMGPNLGRVTLHDKKDCGRSDCPNSSAYIPSTSQPGSGRLDQTVQTSSSRVSPHVSGGVLNRLLMERK
ncbi:hypothetical protein PAXRUDRAFT_144846 [Paxillus rubicundulus Ve08.2h10]|uniref:Uncharacterized protein n=1 Tax=Paxillus rubicundulus Ve08.2h10 TaxID=930991 RepID=A0A0D0E6W2_9AGAM|nr:hypothetical protein PAXRUDRAFT_144846 [Paxillus rubicundulus Ve08.2h10]